MIKIAPSILSADFANLQRDVDAARDAGADYLHVDVMDGMFVPNISIGVPVVKSLRGVTDMTLDVHLMIVEPLRYVRQFIEAGADILTFHVEADTRENIHAAIELTHELGKKAGVVLKPGTAYAEATPYIEDIEILLVMTVEPGFGGQSFMPDMLPKIASVRAEIETRGLGCELEVDGGINRDTAKLVIEAGANVLVAGNAFYGAEDRPLRVRELRGE